MGENESAHNFNILYCGHLNISSLLFQYFVALFCFVILIVSSEESKGEIIGNSSLYNVGLQSPLIVTEYHHIYTLRDFELSGDVKSVYWSCVQNNTLYSAMTTFDKKGRLLSIAECQAVAGNMDNIDIDKYFEKNKSQDTYIYDDDAHTLTIRSENNALNINSNERITYNINNIPQYTEVIGLDGKYHKHSEFKYLPEKKMIEIYTADELIRRYTYDEQGKITQILSMPYSANKSVKFTFHYTRKSWNDGGGVKTDPIDSISSIEHDEAIAGQYTVFYDWAIGKPNIMLEEIAVKGSRYYNSTIKDDNGNWIEKGLFNYQNFNEILCRYKRKITYN